MIGAGGTVIVATRNRGKTREFRAAFAQLGLETKDLNELEQDIPEIEETGATFYDNALIKAQAVAKATGLPALADDSGLCVDALQGAPGVYSARYAGEGAGDADNNAKLLRELAAAVGERSADFAVIAAEAGASLPEGARLLSPARFVSSLVLAYPDGRVRAAAEGEVRGFIVDRPAGAGGFGYDPLFWLPELGKTMAEVTVEEKNALSHRGHALRKLLGQLQPDSGRNG